MELDQRSIWEGMYEDRPERSGDTGQTEFAIQVAGLLKSTLRILELGCGPGDDARYFASLGHMRDNPRFEVHDIAAPFERPAASFDLIYARLSLHYFPDSVMRNIFREMHRLLAPEGLLAFICKSTLDPLYGKGRLIERDMFEDHHVRHFFSEAYARECLRDGFALELLESHSGLLYERESAYVSVVARRTANQA
jgi:SAM-dependent methyltransferase